MTAVSIITASYNYQDYIKETIESVLNQTFQDWEMIIVDDGSNDNSIDVIKSYCKKDSRVKLYTHEGNINRGLSETIQLGLSKAKGSWVAFLESDDIWEPNCLEEKFKVVKQNPNVEFVYSDLEMFGDSEQIELNNKLFYNKLCTKAKSGKQEKDFSHLFLYHNWICTFSIVMCKKALFETCNFNSPLKAALDYYLWTQIAQKCKFYYIDKKLTRWRIHANSYIHNRTNYDSSETQFYKDIANYTNGNLLAKTHSLLFKLLKLKRRKIFRIRTGKNKQFCIFGKNYLKNS